MYRMVLIVARDNHSRDGQSHFLPKWGIQLTILGQGGHELMIREQIGLAIASGEKLSGVLVEMPIHWTDDAIIQFCNEIAVNLRRDDIEPPPMYVFGSNEDNGESDAPGVPIVGWDPRPEEVDLALDYYRYIEKWLVETEDE